MTRLASYVLLLGIISAAVLPGAMELAPGVNPVYKEDGSMKSVLVGILVVLLSAAIIFLNDRATKKDF